MRLSESFFRFPRFERRERMKNRPEKTVIAYRKSCQAKGTGLSHYILISKKGK